MQSTENESLISLIGERDTRRLSEDVISVLLSMRKKEREGDSQERREKNRNLWGPKNE